MLDSIRQNAQSWGVKLIFGLIILVFVFWGVGSMNSGKTSVVANINGKPLLLNDFSHAYERRLQDLSRRIPNLDPEMVRQLQVKQAVFQEIVERQLLLDEADSLGITVSDIELQQQILEIPAFKDESGRFDQNVYRRLLNTQGMTPTQFESQIADSIKLQKLNELAGHAVQIQPNEGMDLFYYASERIRIEYLLDSWTDEVGDFEPGDAEIQVYYDEHQADWMEPTRIKLSYLMLTPKTLARGQDVTEKDIEEFYATHAQEYFTQPERIKARHILIKVDENAPDTEVNRARDRIEKIYDRILAGEDFATVARQESEGPTSTKGGDLGWFTRGQMVQAFEEAAFSLDPGEVSPPIRTIFGFHVIKVEDREAARVKPREEVADEIRSMLGEERAGQTLLDNVDLALEQVLNNAPLDEIATTMGLTLEESEPLSRDEAASLLGLEDNALQTLFATPPATVVDSPLAVEQGYMIARVDEAIPASPLPLDQVRDKVVTALKREEGMRKAEEKSAVSLEQYKAGVGIMALPDFSVSDPFSRNGAIPGLGQNQDLVNAAFAAEPGEWLPQAYEVNDGYIIARLMERLPPDEKAWVEQSDQWLQRLRENAQMGALNAHIQDLRAKAEIEILAPDALQ